MRYLITLKHMGQGSFKLELSYRFPPAGQLIPRPAAKSVNLDRAKAPAVQIHTFWLVGV